MKFQTTIRQAGKTATGIEVPADVVEALGAGKKPPVRVTIAGYTYRSTIASRSGTFLVGVSADVRAASGVAGGDEVDVEIELDSEPRVVEVPDDLAQALAAAGARDRFDALSYSRKQAYVQPVEQAKTDDTRQRRIAKAVSELS